MTTATRGPVPKPSAERRRRNAESRTEVVTVSEPVAAPAFDDELHPLARAWYESLPRSGQSQIYEDSDWAYAQVIASTLSRFLNAGSGNANMLASIQHGMSELLTTPGSRLRSRMEIQRAPAEKPANVTDYRARLTKGGRRVG